MDPDRWEPVKAVYHSALDLEPGLRAAFLEQTCRDELDILREVESLLAQSSDDSFLERPAWQNAVSGGDEFGSSNCTAGFQQGAGADAEDSSARRAVKVMLGGAFGHGSALRRFRREAQAVARLSHPNIVGLYDCGELEGGGAYLVMERLHGATLRAEMKRAGIFAPAETADWFEPMLDGLAAAHEQGVVHRDLKPENVVGARRASGSLVVKILDFGLAKIRPLPTKTASHSLTESGVVLGTLAYMAPEQLQGREVDQRADIYSAGVILVEMLTGCRPLTGGVDVRAGYHLACDVPNQAALDAVVQCCLAVAPNSRFPSAAELRAALIPALRKCGGAGAAPLGR